MTKAAKSPELLRDKSPYHAALFFMDKGVVCRYPHIFMKEALDKDFFKFLAGFAGILTVAIVGILAVGYYEMQSGNKASPSQPETVQEGL